MIPEISFIIPAYNSANTIVRCVESIVKWERKIEIIIVDDGSNDNLSSVVEEKFEDDDRIRYIRKENGGVSSARNCGISHASGDFIVFLDADDEIIFDAYEYMLNTIQDTNADWIQGEYEAVKENTNNFVPALSDRIRVVSDNLMDVLDKYYFGYVWGKFFKRELIVNSELRFDETMHYAEDRLFNMKYALLVNKAIYVSSCTNIYYLYKNSLSRRYIVNYSESMEKIRTASKELQKKFRLNFLESTDFEILIGSIRNEMRNPDAKTKECIEFIKDKISNSKEIKTLPVVRKQDVLLKNLILTNNPLLVFCFLRFLNKIKG